MFFSCLATKTAQDTFYCFYFSHNFPTNFPLDCKASARFHQSLFFNILCHKSDSHFYALFNIPSTRFSVEVHNTFQFRGVSSDCILLRTKKLHIWMFGFPYFCHHFGVKKIVFSFAFQAPVTTQEKKEETTSSE